MGVGILTLQRGQVGSVQEVVLFVAQGSEEERQGGPRYEKMKGMPMPDGDYCHWEVAGKEGEKVQQRRVMVWQREGPG